MASLEVGGNLQQADDAFRARQQAAAQSLVQALQECLASLGSAIDSACLSMQDTSPVTGGFPQTSHPGTPLRALPSSPSLACIDLESADRRMEEIRRTAPQAKGEDISRALGAFFEWAYRGPTSSSTLPEGTSQPRPGWSAGSGSGAGPVAGQGSVSTLETASQRLGRSIAAAHGLGLYSGVGSALGALLMQLRGRVSHHRRLVAVAGVPEEDGGTVDDVDLSAGAATAAAAAAAGPMLDLRRHAGPLPAGVLMFPQPPPAAVAEAGRAALRRGGPGGSVSVPAAGNAPTSLLGRGDAAGGRAEIGRTATVAGGLSPPSAAPAVEPRPEHSAYARSYQRQQLQLQTQPVRLTAKLIADTTQFRGPLSELGKLDLGLEGLSDLGNLGTMCPNLRTLSIELNSLTNISGTICGFGY